jgi:acetamidase/formamidase
MFEDVMRSVSMTIFSAKRLRRLLAVLCVAALPGAAAAQAAEPDFAGSWVMTGVLSDGVVSAALELTRSSEGYVGKSGALDTLGARSLDWTGKVVDGRLRLTAHAQGFDLGQIDLSLQAGALTGQGRLFETPIKLSGQRPAGPAGRAPRTFDHNPDGFHPITSAAPPPALRIYPGDIVRTRTVDAYGMDEKGHPASMPGNPGTGPFYVEGAMPGDTVGIEILGLKTNRPTARMNTALDRRVLAPGYVPAPGAMKDYVWLLDPARGEAAPRTPSDKLKNFKMPLRPMLGVIGVALPGGMAMPNRDLGEWGGNLDYTEIREGTTLYLPVYQAGALIFMGDGHARQAHGEVAGQGLETSLAVEFRVKLLKRQVLEMQPWAENADYIMVSGIAGSLNDAMQLATTGLARWLKATYRLDDSEAAVVLGAALEFDVAEVVDPKFHMVAKIRKDVLSQLPLPPN